MKAKIGIFLMIIGSVLMLSALGLFLCNVHIQRKAAEASMELMPQLVEKMYERAEETDASAADSTIQIPDAEPLKMAVEEIDGHGYVGFVSIPGQKLELPIMADWSYPQLQMAPCRFYGDMYTNNLVIMAHNYEKHFGGLQKLRPGDPIMITDMDGKTLEYEVIALDILQPDAVEEMTSGEFDLTLFTCTYGGKTRVTVRCDRKH